MRLADLKIDFVAGTLGQGGAERQLYYMVRCLRENGASVRVLSLTRGEFWEENIRALGAPVIWVGENPSRMARLRRIVREIRRQRPDILQGQHFYTNLYVSAAGRLLGIPEHGAIRNDVHSEIASNGAVMGRLSLMLPRAFIANSRAAVDNAIAHKCPARKLFYLPNVIDTTLFRPRETHGDGQPLLLSVGRLDRQKRHDRFLNILARFQFQFPSVRGVIVGDGPLRSELERQAFRLGLSPDRVQFRGVVADLMPLYQTAAALVLTSDHEGMPNVVLEAMASGLPVVCSRVGGISDAVEDGVNGFLLDPTDEEGFLHRIGELLAAPELRAAVGERARATVQARYSCDRLADNLMHIYSAALLRKTAIAPAAGRVNPSRSS